LIRELILLHKFKSSGMNLQQRKDLLVELGKYMLGKEEPWQEAQHRAYVHNRWFTPEFQQLSIQAIARNYLQPEPLDQLSAQYGIPEENRDPRKVGIVMAGNIPMVGFHDLLCVFLTGHQALVKVSTKDDVLIPHLMNYLIARQPELSNLLNTGDMIPNCDAYIATGSNNSARYFDYYFKKYPSIIRRNRTSVALLTGKESPEELSLLADDVYQYFGLGCRNVTKLYVPAGYDFIPLLTAFRKYDYLANHNKYKNNYDYNLAVYILNNRKYMSNESILLVEDPALFSPIGQLNYEFYTDAAKVTADLKNSESVQCMVGQGFTPFGSAQQPGLTDFADGTDTIAFLLGLKNEGSGSTKTLVK
jgi:hypothetical protein